MKNKKAFITGINGQDGSYLTELLLQDGYEIHGIIRRHSISETQDERINKLGNEVKTYYCDITNSSRINYLLKEIQPNYIFHLAAQSHVRVSFDDIDYTINNNIMGITNMLEAYRNNCPAARFYFAASSEMFGNSMDDDKFQRETTPMHPVSPYGCSKLFGYSMVRHYRRAYNLFASNGILFNHESPRRGSAFVTGKIAKTVAEIKLGISKELVLGNISSFRDWGHSRDYVKAMNLILNHSHPDDFVISTGETHSIEEFCQKAFSIINLDWKDYVKYDKKYLRNEELDFLRGDSTKAKNILGWKPETSFDEMITEMVDHWTNKLQLNK